MAAPKKIAPMKGKRTTKATVRDAVPSSNRNNNNDDTNQISHGASTQGSMIPEPSRREIQQFIALAMAPQDTQQAQHNQGQSDLFKLPPEVRRMVFDLVFSTGTIDTNNNRVIVVEERRKLRTRREHDYKVVNFDPKQLSLNLTCRQVKDEIHEYLWEHTSFKFSSTRALSSFVGCHEEGQEDIHLALLNLPILRKAQKIEAVVKTDGQWADNLVSLRAIGGIVRCTVEVELLDDIPNTLDTTRTVLAARTVMSHLEKHQVEEEDVEDGDGETTMDTA